MERITLGVHLSLPHQDYPNVGMERGHSALLPRDSLWSYIAQALSKAAMMERGLCAYFSSGESHSISHH